MKESRKETPIRMADSGLAFRQLCEKHGITPTHRQFKKWLRNKGRLYNAIQASNMDECVAEAAAQLGA